MSRILRITIAFLFIALLGACSTFQVGHDFDAGIFAAKIEPGATTQAQVRSWLGEPSSVGVSVEADGTHYDQWDYYYAQGDMSDMSKTKTKMLQVKFDKAGKVRSYSWSTSR